MAPADDHGLPDDLRTEMRQGFRRWMSGPAKSRQPGRVKRWSANAMLGMLAAATAAPVIVSVATGQAVPELISSTGGLGTNILSELIVRLADRMRSPSRELAERELLAELRTLLEADDERAAALSRELARLLRGVGATEIIAESSGWAEAAETLDLLGSSFSELAFLQLELNETVRRIEAAVQEQNTALQRQEDRLDRVSELARDVHWLRWRTEPEPQADVPLAGCPYMGLEPYGVLNRPFFYGREEETELLREAMAARVRGPGLHLLAGASGAGKTSLLHAGVLPSLSSGLPGLPEAARWPRTIMNPTRAPLAQLKARLGAAFGFECPALEQQPHRAHEVVHELLVRHAEDRPPGRLILIVDQFEEIFTLVRSAGEAEAFLEVLRAISEEPVGPDDAPAAVVVLGVRADFWGRCAEHDLLRAAQDSRSTTLGPMSDSGRLQAVVGPAEKAGLKVENALVQVLMDELRARPKDMGVLPLLSQAMLMTWRNREGDRLTLRGYDRAGRIEQAVRNAAEEVYGDLPPHRQEVARRLFLRLTQVVPDGHARRTLSLDQVDDDGRTVLHAFAAMRLVVLGEKAAEISHDVLLDAWPRLGEWLEGDRPGRLLVARMQQQAEDWEQHGRRAELLYPARRLKEVRLVLDRWAGDDRYPAVEPVAARFLEASAVSLRRRRVRRLAFGTAAVATVTVAGLLAANSVQEAAARDRRAMSAAVDFRSRSVRQDDPFLAGLLSATSFRIAPGDESRQGMIDFLATTARAVLPSADVAGFSPDGARLATIETGGVIKLLDTRTRRPILTIPTGHTGAVHHVRFGPDGKTLATYGQDHTVRLWDAASGRPLAAPIQPVADTGDHNGRISSIAFAPDGRTLAVATTGGRVTFWNGDRPDGRQIQTGGPVDAMMFGPDGRTLSAVVDDRLRAWDRSTGRASSAIPGTVTHADVSGDRLVTSTGDEVRLWNAATLRPAGAPIRTGPIDGLALSDDGGTLAVISDRRNIQYWDLATRRRVGTTVTGHTGDIHAVRFAAGDTLLATLGGDATARLWNAKAMTELGAAVQAGDSATVSFTPDGRALAMATEGGLRLRDLATGRLQALPPGAIALSPDGRTVATVTGGKLTLKDRATGRPTGTPLPLADGRVAFSPDWRLAAIAVENDIQVWNLATGKPVGPVMTGHGAGPQSYDPDDTVVTGPVDGIADMAFTPDGKLLASVGVDLTLRFWDVGTGSSTRFVEDSTEWVEIDRAGRHAVTLGISADEKHAVIRVWDVATRQPIGDAWQAHGLGGAGAAAFSPDGRVIATGGRDGEIRLWDVATRRPLGNPLAGPRADVTSLAFSPDGATLAGASADGTVRRWAVAFPEDPLAAVCEVAGRSLTQEEWRRNLPTTTPPETLACAP
ncbi:WD40 repeat domain-containing protein [Nonomuraea sp. NPDC048881]|uniref:WD40 repeat domain-containing protein n=1 Tax=Nonomuraea sp. NPDC048881 TaxID=3155030 RepID=UPI0033F5A443